MHVAIVGAGFSGVATAWNCLQFPNIQVTVFDSAGVGKGTSGIAAGLMHPYAGAHAKKSWLAEEGWKETSELLSISSTTLGKPVVEFTGLVRLATDAAQKEDFAVCAQRYSDVIPWTTSQTQQFLPSIKPHEAIFIKQCAIVDCENYLKGLWLACERKGAQFKQSKIAFLEELKNYDVVVMATGAATTKLPEFAHLPITQVKGQVLKLKWPHHLQPLQYPVNSYAYLMMQNNQECIAGATYEREYHSEEVDVEAAASDIIPKLQTFLPDISYSNILGCRAGMRASTPDHRPLLQRINERCWVLSGMGSKGLLYHALFAKQLVKEITLMQF